MGYEDLVIRNNKLDRELYSKYDVKQGLRNENGSGVLVGLTRISAVLGFEKIDEDIIPIEGILKYRDTDVKDLIEKSFDEVAFLLLFGELPQDVVEFSEKLKNGRSIPQNFTENVIMKARGKDLMNMLSKSVLALYALDENGNNISVSNVIKQSLGLIAKFPTIIAYSYHAMRHVYYNDSLVIHHPINGLNSVENFLHLLRKDGKFTKLEAETLEKCLILHMEHGGGNNSTFTTRVITSSGTDTYSAIAGGIGSLKGPLHGGANLKVMGMMNYIKEHCAEYDEKSVTEALGKLLRKEGFDASGKIYGFGHAVYTLSDPRAVLLKEQAKALAIEKGREKEYELYLMIEKLVPTVFEKVTGKKKVLCANVDFFSGFVYDMLGIPEEVYTPMFAMARIVGWCAHRIEELVTSNRIIRPAYKAIK